MRRRTLIRHLAATAVTAPYSTSFIRASSTHCDRIDSSLSSIEQRVFEANIRRQSPHLLVIGTLLAAQYYSSTIDISSIRDEAIIDVVHSNDFHIQINNNITYFASD